jgi:hypothetical protein
VERSKILLLTLISCMPQWTVQSCLSENPLAFVEDIQSNISSVRSKLLEIYEPLQMVMQNKTEFSTMMKDCEENGMYTIQGASETIELLLNAMQQNEGSFKAALDVSACSSISPIFRRLTFGATCTKSVEYLGWTVVL